MAGCCWLPSICCPVETRPWSTVWPLPPSPLPSSSVSTCSLICPKSRTQTNVIQTQNLLLRRGGHCCRKFGFRYALLCYFCFTVFITDSFEEKIQKFTNSSQVGTVYPQYMNYEPLINKIMNCFNLVYKQYFGCKI